MAKETRLLYLDDEENNLRTFKAALRRDYEVYTAIDPATAFDLINKKNPHIVFSDQRMPKMSGVDFLEQVRQQHPNVIRILITGYADIENVIEAINKGHVYRYLTKPWDEKEVRIAIDNGYELFKTKADLQQKMERLERTNEELNRFIYSTSHDLRSPVVTSLGLLNIADMEVQNPKAKQYFSMIKESLLRIDDYIKNILNYYQNSKFEKALNNTNINQLVSDVIESLQTNIDLKRAKVTTDIPEALYWSLDDFRLRIILNNLLTNALNFKQKDVPLKVTIRARESNEALTVEVSDNGMGMPKNIQDKIFKMFFRGTHEAPGTGLGLYIVREAVSEMDSSIRVDSKPGAGAAFTVTVPRQT